MISLGLLASDLSYVRRHILEKRKELREEHVNMVVYEVLAYLQKGVMPAIREHSPQMQSLLLE